MKKLHFVLVMVLAAVILRAEEPPTILFNEAFGPEGSWGDYEGAADAYTNWTDHRAGHTTDPIRINNWKQSAGYEGATGDMAFQSRWASYSFTFTGIDISGYEDLVLSFGLYWDSWFQAGYKPVVQVRVDGGDWVTLANADQPWPTPDTQVDDVWSLVTISSGIPEGDAIDIKFATHSDPQNMCIDDVKLTGVLKNGDDPQPDVSEWHFETDGDSQGWGAVGAATVITVEDGNLKAVHDVALDNEGPKIINSSLGIDASAFTHAEIKMKTVNWIGGGKQLRFFWAREDSPDLGGDKLITVGGINPDADIYQTIIVNLDHAQWSGTITTIRMDLLMWNGIEVHVDHIKLVGPTETETFTLTVTVEGEGMVEVDNAPYTEPLTFDEGTEVTLKALADAGYQFDGWSGASDATDDEITLVMDADKQITATFTDAEPQEFALTVNITGQGSVEVNEITYTEPLTFDAGTEVTLKALADAGYQFDGWSGASDATDDEITLVMDADKQITATFTPIAADNYILVLMDFEEPLGTDGYNVGLTEGHVSEVRVENPLKQGINTSDWVLKSDLNAYGAEPRFITFVFDEDVTMHGKSKARAMFYVDPNDSGNALHAQMEFYDENDVMVSSGNQWFGEGYQPGEWRSAAWAGNSLTDVTFRKVKITFWDDWGGSGVARPVYIDNFELLNDGDVYEPVEGEYSLTILVDGEGTVNVNNEPYIDMITVSEGTELTLQALPADGYTFDGWSGDLTSESAEETITMDAHKTITANFTAIPDLTIFAWEFETDGDSEGWEGVGEATTIAVEDGNLKAVHNVDLDIEGPKIINTGLNLDASAFTHAEIKMKTVNWIGGDKQLRFFWAREDSPDLGGDKLITVGGITPDADNYQTITVDLDHAQWNGTITTIRFDLLMWNGIEVHVDYIKLIGPAETTPTARLQLIHNSADLAAETVDVFVNGALFEESFAFRTATKFEDVPAGVDLTIDIAPADAGIEASVFQTTVNLNENEAYIVVANGIVSTDGYDPLEPFAVYPYSPAREAAVNNDETDLLVFHGATDAPTVSVWVMDGENELFNFSYGEFEDYLSLPTDNYILEVRTEDGSAVVETYSVPLALLNLEGAALTVLASGFLNPAVNSDGPAFGLFVATGAGGDLLPLPLYVPTFDYTALLMNFELPLGTDGYDVESTWGQIDHGVMDNPAQVGINTSEKVYKSHREAGNWNSGIKFVFDSDVDDLGETNIRVKIHPVDRALNHVYFKFYDENDVVVSEGWHSTGSLPAGEWSYAVYSKDISGITFRKLDLNFSDEWGNTTSESTVYFDDLELFTPTVPETYTLTVNLEGAGVVEVNGTLYSEPVIVDEGTTLTLKAIADEGNQFDGWSGASDSTADEISLVMDENKTITATFSAIVGIDELSAESILIYPNPANDNFNINAGSVIRSIVIADITGKVVYNDIINDTQTSIYNTFETGIYIVRIFVNDGVFTRKLQIVK